jgi:plastocyanin
MLRRAAFLVAILTGLASFATPAEALTKQISIHNDAFVPTPVTVVQGATVTWTNNDPVDHTSTSDQGFWDSGHITHGHSYSQTATFRNAGTYGYICTIHGFAGTVLVPLNATGTARHGYTLRWSSASSTPAHRNFDVQIKRPGAAKFASFRSKTAALTAFVDPAKAGTYRFRARTRNTSNGQTSGWSPVKTLSIS